MILSKNFYKPFLSMLLLVAAAAVTPVTAEDTRVKEELAAPMPETPLKYALGEKAYSEAMASGEYQYVGSSKCRLCHRAFFVGRKKDKHDFAMDSLVDSGHKDEPRCLACHATGYGVKTGFVTIKETPRLANIQCEGCHGPGNLHVERSGVRTSGGSLLVTPKQPEIQAKICKACHTQRWNRSYDDLSSTYVKYSKPDPNQSDKK